jgi:hypothetical protein
LTARADYHQNRRDIAVVIKSALKLAAVGYGYASEAGTVKLPKNKTSTVTVFSECEMSLLADVILAKLDVRARVFY